MEFTKRPGERLAYEAERVLLARRTKFQKLEIADTISYGRALFLERPEVGLVWLARSGEVALGACVVCYAISTARGSLVAKLDDVTIREGHRSEGVGTAMLVALGTNSCSSSTRFGPTSAVNDVTPVRLPPGRARLTTSPAATGS